MSETVNKSRNSVTIGQQQRPFCTKLHCVFITHDMKLRSKRCPRMQWYQAVRTVEERATILCYRYTARLLVIVEKRRKTPNTYLKFFTEQNFSRRSPLLCETVFQQLSKVSASQNKTKPNQKYIIRPTKMTH
jgi:ABC-type dipeptide/oligopeptide/nickel transport system ATPase component